MEINKIRMRQFMIGARRTLNTGVIDVLWPVAARRTSPKPGVSKIYSSELVRAPVMSGLTVTGRPIFGPVRPVYDLRSKLPRSLLGI